MIKNVWAESPASTTKFLSWNKVVGTIMTFCPYWLDQLIVQWPVDDSKNTLPICIPSIIFSRGVSGETGFAWKLSSRIFARCFFHRFATQVNNFGTSILLPYFFHFIFIMYIFANVPATWPNPHFCRYIFPLNLYLISKLKKPVFFQLSLFQILTGSTYLCVIELLVFCCA